MSNSPLSLDQQEPGGLAGTVRARITNLFCRQCRARGQQGIHGVALAAATGPPGRPINFGDRGAGFTQRAEEARAMAAGALDRPEQPRARCLLGDPGEQLLIAVGVGADDQACELAADRIGQRSGVGVAVSVDTDNGVDLFGGAQLRPPWSRLDRPGCSTDGANL
ncbi:hypothetical protein GCM10009539_22770 [Cryptosporangium japonicum]|uniref:Uncharacterized protein n=1 Tax=Cryptosporangium japonicum TaxID=80872 RepID=A0ABN0U2Y3_9ACTN